MAETFKSVNADLGTSSNTVIYTCPSSTTAIVILCQVANVDGSNSADLYMDYYDSSATQAKALAYALGIVMANHQGRLEKLIVDNKSNESDEVVTVTMDGGSDWK